MNLHKAKMREHYKDKKIDDTFNDMREQFLKTAEQRRHMRKVTKKNDIIEKNDIVHCLDYSGEDDE
jgi:predicted RNA-binding protein with RPS1 domain